jgi:hypothetical protein
MHDAAKEMDTGHKIDIVWTTTADKGAVKVLGVDYLG